MLVKKFLLLFAVLIFFIFSFYLSSLFVTNDSVTSKPEVEPVDNCKTIPTPIVLSTPSPKRKDEEEVLLKLKLAVADTINDEPSIEEAEADKILNILEEKLVSKKEVPVVVPPKEKTKKVIIKKKVIKSKPIVKKVTVLKEHKVIKSKPVVKKVTDLKEHNVFEKVSPIISLPSLTKNSKTVKPNISLGEQDDVHTLSQTERERFEHLEVVSVSEVFALESEVEIKNPIEIETSQKEVNLNDLNFVETLGVVSKSIPSTNRDEE